jgi:hypothetical protein
MFWGATLQQRCCCCTHLSQQHELLLKLCFIILSLG